MITKQTNMFIDKPLLYSHYPGLPNTCSHTWRRWSRSNVRTPEVRVCCHTKVIPLGFRPSFTGWYSLHFVLSPLWSSFEKRFLRDMALWSQQC